MFHINVLNLTPAYPIFDEKPTPENWLTELKQLLMSDTVTEQDLQVITENPFFLELYQYLSDKKAIVLTDEEKKQIITQVTQQLTLDTVKFQEQIQDILHKIKFPRCSEHLIHLSILQHIAPLPAAEHELYCALAKQMGLLLKIPYPNMSILERSKPENIEKIQGLIQRDISTYFQLFQLLFKIQLHLRIQLKNDFDYNPTYDQSVEPEVYQKWLGLLMRLLENDERFHPEGLLIKNDDQQVIAIDWNTFNFYLILLWYKKGLISCPDEDFGLIATLLLDKCANEKQISEYLNRPYFLENVEEFSAFLECLTDSKILQKTLKNFLLPLSFEQQLTCLCSILNLHYGTTLYDEYLQYFQALNKELDFVKKLFSYTSTTQPFIINYLSEKTIPHVEQLYAFLGYLSPADTYNLLAFKPDHDQHFLMMTASQYPQKLGLVLHHCKRFEQDQLFHLFSDTNKAGKTLLEIAQFCNSRIFNHLLKFFSQFIPQDYQLIILNHKNPLGRNLLLHACYYHKQHIVALLKLLSQFEPHVQINLMKDKDYIDECDSLTGIITSHPLLIKNLFEFIDQLPAIERKNLFVQANAQEKNVLHYCDKLGPEQLANMLEKLESIEPGLATQLLLTPDNQGNSPLFHLRSSCPTLGGLLHQEIQKLDINLQIDMLLTTNKAQQSYLDILLSQSQDEFAFYLNTLLSHAPERSIPITQKLLKKLMLNSDGTKRLVGLFLNSQTISPWHLNLLADLFTTQTIPEGFFRYLCTKYLAVYQNPTEPVPLARLYTIFNLLLHKASINGTFYSIINHNISKFYQTPNLLNRIIRILLHSSTVNLNNLTSLLINQHVDVASVLNPQNDEQPNLLHFSIEEDIQTDMLQSLIQTYLMQNKLFEGLFACNPKQDNVLQSAIRKSSYLLPTLIEGSLTLTPHEQMALVTGDRNYLLFTLQNRSFALPQIIEVFNRFHSDIMTSCLSEQLLWKQAIQMANGSLEVLIKTLEAQEKPRILQVFEAQEQAECRTIFEKLPNALQQEMKQLTSVDKPSLHSIFASVEQCDQDSPELKKSRASQP